jgi:urease accessory protein
MQARTIRQFALLATALSIGTTPAAAHHAMDGKLPATLWEGFVSGLAHPVIGPDHLAFIVAIGIAAALVPAGIRLVAAFVAASTAGVLAHLGLAVIPMTDALIAASVIAAGTLVALGRGASSGQWLALAALAGIAHGYAFGEAIVGAESAVVGAYLAGLAIVTTLLGACICAAAQRLLSVDRPASHLRLAGGALACLGIVLLTGSLVAA